MLLTRGVFREAGPLSEHINRVVGDVSPWPSADILFVGSNGRFRDEPDMPYHAGSLLLTNKGSLGGSGTEFLTVR